MKKIVELFLMLMMYFTNIFCSPNHTLSKPIFLDRTFSLSHSIHVEHLLKTDHLQTDHLQHQVCISPLAQALLQDL